MVSPHRADQIWRGYEVDFKIIDPKTGRPIYVDLNGSCHLYLTKEKQIYFQERHEALSGYFGPLYLVLTTGENPLDATLFDSFVRLIRDRFSEINKAKEINDAKSLQQRIENLPTEDRTCCV
jgi:hypothetical protein